MDETTLRSIEEQGVAQFLEGIQAELKAGRYRPSRLALKGSGAYFTPNEGSELPISLQGNPTLATLNYSGTIEAASTESSPASYRIN